MNIQGKLHRITDVKTFISSHMKSGFVPWGKARVHLDTDFPNGEFRGGYFPSMSLKVDTNNQGVFNFTVPDAFAKTRGRVLALSIGSTPNPFPGMPPIPVFSPIYRSQVFNFTDVSAAEQAQVQNIFIFPAKTPTENGVSQEELNAELGALKTSQKLDKLNATIGSHHISVSAEKSGGNLKFNANVGGSTSHDLERVIEVKAGEIDLDLPGPDFIVGLCIDEDEIEASIRKGLSKMSAKVSETLLGELDKQFPGISSQATVSVWRTRHVQTDTKAIKFPGRLDGHVPVFTVVPDGALGVPRKLY
jgi:hypothetical protein